jgi:hypothetical protein
MNTPHGSYRRSPLRALCALGLTLAALAAGSAPAAAHVSPAQAEHAAERGVGWFLTHQKDTGSLSSDWALTALAATGLNAADARTSLLDPSAQDFYLGGWQAAGPGGAPTDAERAILAGTAGGIQTSRLSTSAEAAKSNLVARVAEFFDGEQIGLESLLSDDIFGVLALHHAGAPPELLRALADYLRSKQLPGGGFSWSASPEAIEDPEMTGATLAALCAAGASPSDPAVAQGLDFLQTAQDAANGGFAAPFGIGVNTDTTGWIVSGLVQCGVDPQGPEWTTAAAKTPLDYLLSMQRPDGHFDWKEGFSGGAFETYSAVRPLAGAGFSAPAPPRLDGVSPAVRPVEVVPDGTTVPIALAIDHGPGADDVRICRVDTETGSSLGEALADAQAASTPADCVTEFAIGGGGDLDSLNGVAEAGGNEWRVGIGGDEPTAVAGKPVGFGDLVFLEYAGPESEAAEQEEIDVPPVGAAAPVALARLLRPRVAVRGPARLHRGRVLVRLDCPRGNGGAGCRGAVRVLFKRHRRGRALVGARTGFRLRSGAVRVVRAGTTRALRRTVRRRHRVRLRVVVATRAEDGGLRLTQVKRFIRR